MPKRQISLKKNRKNKKSYKLRGGEGAAEHALMVYGSGDNQHAVAGSNVIAMNNPFAMTTQSGGNEVPNTVVPTTVSIGGGKKRRRNGGNLLQAVIAPVVLLGLNQTIGKTLSNKKKSYTKKYRK
jgi:hypothetical protein